MNEDNAIYLSEIPTGNKCIIVKIDGYGSFRHRLMEMGFVKGETVTVIKNAPLRDPIEYEIMGSHVSLRRDEAEHIEVADISSYKRDESTPTTFSEEVKMEIEQKSRTINIALVGNPNSGKTSLFNVLTGMHEKVGNYTGVTVSTKSARFDFQGYTFNIVDLPGTYSIAEFSPEELYVRKYIMEEHPDIVLNVVDASNLERNLFLTTQLIDMNVRVVMALNMFDELEKSGNTLDYQYLGDMLGFRIVPTSAHKGIGIDKLLSNIIDTYEDKVNTYRHIHINYGNDIEHAIDNIKNVLPKNTWVTDHYTPRYIALQLLQSDKSIGSLIAQVENAEEINRMVDDNRRAIQLNYKDEPANVITNAKYGFIRGAMRETFHKNKTIKRNLTPVIDNILTNRWLGFPILFLFLYVMFETTFTLGGYPQGWIELGIELLSTWLLKILPGGALTDLLVSGIIGGVGSVLVFLPNILILFFFVSIMEDTGYMARAAFIMDKLMHKIGLHGKSFIPLLMGFGCSVPAIMSTRILENRKNRIMTMMIIPLMSCSARLPIYVLLISAFFTKHQALVLMSLYLLGIMFGIIVSLIMNHTIFKGKLDHFVLELPPYRIPTARNVMVHIWERTKEYLKKISSIILIASVIIWCLEYFPQQNDVTRELDNQIAAINDNATEDKAAEIEQLENAKISAQKEYSYIGRIGKFIEPVMRPLGFDWRMSVSLLTGAAAKEVVVSSLGILFNDHDETGTSMEKHLIDATYDDNPGKKVFSPLVAYSFMVFVLLYFPCIGTIATVRREYGRKWSAVVVIYTVALAWLASFGIFQLGSLIW